MWRVHRSAKGVEMFGKSLLAGVFVVSLACGAGTGTPEDFALWLEQSPGTHEVTVLGSWAVENVQGWCFGLCHDPDEASLCSCLCTDESSCRACTCITVPEDTLTSNCQRPDGVPDLLEIQIYENGVALNCVPWISMFVCMLPAADRFELLKITYELRGEQATLEFCDHVAVNPPLSNLVIQNGYSFAPARQEGLTLYTHALFRRGDTNIDGEVNIADAVYLLNALFHGGPALRCTAAADANDSNGVDIADAISILGHLFRNTGPLPEPFASCGPDPTPPEPPLTCFEFPPCLPE